MPTTIARSVLAFWTVGLLAGCPASAPRMAAAGEQTAPAAGALQADPSAGSVGNLNLGMTEAQAIAAAGTPETRYPDFMAWHGGKIAATIAGGHVVALRVFDKSISIMGLHVGETLAQAQKIFPGGTFQTGGELPYYVLPGGHAFLQLAPSFDHTVIAVRMGAAVPTHEDFKQ